MTQHRIGIDLGGTKIEIAVLAPDGSEALRHRIPTPPSGYPATIAAIAQLVRDTEAKLGITATVGIGIPGVISPATGRVKNANSTTLNGHPFDQDMSDLLGREVRVENDANCFTLSEAADGAGAGYRLVFGIILGTGVGGGIAVDGRVHRGPHAVAGEWGHNPLPWMLPAEYPGPQCWCGLRGCLESFVAGPALARDCDGPDFARRQPPARARRRRRPTRAGCPGPPHRPPRPRPRTGHQFARSRRDRAGRRAVQHGASVYRAAETAAAPCVQRCDRHADFAEPAWGFVRRAWRGMAMAGAGTEPLPLRGRGRAR